jgi:hypothetical protein
MAGLFQSDNDADIAVDVIDEIASKLDLPDSAVGALRTRALPQDPIRGSCWHMDEAPDTEKILEQIRQALDAGTGEMLLQMSLEDAQTKDPEDFNERNQYNPIVLSAILMMVGAKISGEHVGRLRTIALDSPGPESYVWPLAGDNYFRGPGKRQYLAALDHYRQGVPRDFHKPTCHACGKAGCDIGRKLHRCGGCRNRNAAAWFCGKVSRRLAMALSIR